MSDLERLDEALAWFESTIDDPTWEGTKLAIVAFAARAYRDLLTNGEVVDNTVIAWPGVEGLGPGKYLVVELDPTTEEETK